MNNWKRAALAGAWAAGVVWASLGCWTTVPNSSCNKASLPPSNSNCGYTFVLTGYCASVLPTETAPYAFDSTTLSQVTCAGYVRERNIFGVCVDYTWFSVPVTCRQATGSSCGSDPDA